MTREEHDQIMQIIKSHFHIEYVGNGYPKMVITTDNLHSIEEQIGDLINAKKEH